ncbi:hypothetical protein MCG98_16485 [Ruminococcus sp. OA3]|uniref:phage tail tube protein n=1 Tax=Ruminococcus sp. OA3 TaxID=2914164 RepID=UPI001F06E309|nr:hypothetical protein [Ruminococcus sp. OA3]MCH1984165.1 hypothetical protein [Ruminococcus sp. OA3]
MLNMNLQKFAETLPENTITPEINYETEAFINTTPTGQSATWATLGALTKNMAESLNEVLYQASYYKDQGWGSTEVVGAQLTLTLTGDCKPTDPAYEYITGEDVMYKFGEARKTHIKVQRGNAYVIWPVTLANITKGRGDSTATNALTVTIHGNGQPSLGTTGAEG